MVEIIRNDSISSIMIMMPTPTLLRASPSPGHWWSLSTCLSLSRSLVEPLHVPLPLQVTGGVTLRGGNG